MLREFLYVDVTRVRSLLSQLDSGVVESVVDRRMATQGSTFGVKALGLSGMGSLESATSREESRSVQDLLFAVFEEAAQSDGLVAELGPEFSDSTRWESSEIHGKLVEGQLIKVFCPLLVVDPDFLRQRFARFIALNDALSAMTRAQFEQQVAELQQAMQTEIEEAVRRLPRDKQTPERKRREAEVRRLVKEAEAGLTQSTDVGPSVLSVADVINAFVASDAISVRFLACGHDRPELAFSGSLLGRDEYIQRERDALFARYGSLLEGWTALLQVASIPKAESLSEALRATSPSSRSRQTTRLIALR